MDKKLKLYVFVLTFLSNQDCFVNGACNRFYGPSGSEECVLLEGYDRPQWSTCLSDNYIKASSNNRHECPGYITLYCYYQCMIEKYDKEEGPVYDDCACGPANFTLPTTPSTTVTTPSSTTIIPNWCFDPNGTNCDWYSQCLQRLHPCRPNHYNGYAVEYAEEFCNLYNRFTSTARSWIGAVRRCLEFKLVTILRPHVITSCEQIHETALQIQEPCYTEPYPGGPSICDLDLYDWGKVFWTIKGQFADATILSLKNMIDVTNKCSNNVLQDVLNFESNSVDSEMRLIRLTLVKNIGKRSVSSEYGETADSVAKQLAQHQRWSAKGVQWFSFVSTGVGGVGINVLLAPTTKYNINAAHQPPVEMNKTLHDLVDAFNNNEISLKVERSLRLTEFRICLDFGCHETYGNVTRITQRYTNGAAVKSLHQLLIFSTICLLLNPFLPRNS